MTGPVAVLLPDGKRLHLQHGPIDLIIGAEGANDSARRAAFQAATVRFQSVLQSLVDELPDLRQPIGRFVFKGAIARRMAAAVRPHESTGFITPMAAVAGAVADEVLAAMLAAVPLRRAYVNNGGDIALHLRGGERFRMAMAGLGGRDFGRIDIGAADGISGIATSGFGGRSLSFGIAESVTVLAKTAALADAGATMIANAVNLPDHSAIKRQAARSVFPDSDLGDRLVVRGCGDLSSREVAQALENGAGVARAVLASGLICGACLFLRGRSLQVTGAQNSFELSTQEVAHA